MREARVAADAIGLLTLYVERRCVAALGNNLSTNILRRYAASTLWVYCKTRVTAATRASPEAKISLPLTRLLHAKCRVATPDGEVAKLEVFMLISLYFKHL